MAKRAKTGTGKSAASEIAKAATAQSEKQQSRTQVLIKATTLRQLLSSDDRYKGDIDGLVGELRDQIGNAVEKNHLDKKAYALLKRFHREKSNEKLAHLWDTLLAYMDMAGVMKRIESVSALPLDGEKAEAAAGEDEGDGDEAETGDVSTEEDTGGTIARPTFGGTARAH